MGVECLNREVETAVISSVRAAVSRRNRHDERYVNWQRAMLGGTDHDRRPNAALLVTSGYAEVHHPYLPGRQLERPRHWLYSGNSSLASGRVSPATLSVSRPSA